MAHGEPKMVFEENGDGALKGEPIRCQGFVRGHLRFEDIVEQGDRRPTPVYGLRLGAPAVVPANIREAFR